MRKILKARREVDLWPDAADAYRKVAFAGLLLSVLDIFLSLILLGSLPGSATALALLASFAALVASGALLGRIYST